MRKVEKQLQLTCPHVPCREWAQPGWTESFGCNLGKKGGFMNFGRRGRQFRGTTWVLGGRICREKIRRVTAKPELNLVAAVKDKNCLSKYICNKRRAKEDLHPLLDVEGSSVTKNEGKTAALNASFASVFNSDVSSLGTWAGGQAQGAEGSTLNPKGNAQWSATALRDTQVYGARWDPPKGPEGAGRYLLTQPLSIIFQQSWIIREVPVDWKLTDVMPIYTMGWFWRFKFYSARKDL